MRNRSWVAVAAGTVVGIVGIATVAITTKADDGPEKLRVVSGGASGGERAAVAPASDGATGMRYGGIGEIRVEGTLPSMPGQAHAWALPSPERTQVAQLARAFGVSGTIRSQNGGWAAADGDHRVNVDPSGQWYFGPDYESVCATPERGRSSGDTPEGTVREGCAAPPSGGACPAEPDVECVAPDTPVSNDAGSSDGPPGSGSSSGSTGSAGAPEVSKPGASTSGVAASPSVVEPCPMPTCPPGAACAQVCAPPDPPKPPADLPSKADAERVARDVLTRGGVDVDGARVTVEDGFDRLFVQFSMTVGDVPIDGPVMHVSVGPKQQILDAQGFLGTFERGDEYPLIGVQNALDRLREQPRPMAADAGAAQDIARSSAPAMPALCKPNGDCPEPEPQVVTSVSLALLLTPGERQALLVPAYLFELRGGGRMTAVAIPDKYLQTPEPEPGQTEPAPAPNRGQTEPAPAPQTRVPAEETPSEPAPAVSR